MSQPISRGTRIGQTAPVNTALVCSYVWGSDLSGQAEPAPNGAGGVGGLLWVVARLDGAGGPQTHFCAYDGNGNVAALVKASDGAVSANYEYGPFGEMIRSTGPLAKENPFRFSTKRTCNTTDFVLYEYRVYNPSTGRWLSRDPMEESVGWNLFAAFANNPVQTLDIFGLWNSNIHRDNTTLWAASLGYPAKAAQAVGQANNAVDSPVGHTSYIFEPGTMYHFDRSLSMGYSRDTRLIKHEEHLQKARGLCTIAKGNDEPKAAAKELGTALHPLQDWVAHGDHNVRLLGSFRLNPVFMHNYMSPMPGSEKFPDDPTLDATGSLDERPTLSVLQFVTHPRFPPPTYIFDWADYRPGFRRFTLTMQLSISTLSGFRSYVSVNGGCLCKEYFGVQ